MMEGSKLTDIAARIQAARIPPGVAFRETDHGLLHVRFSKGRTEVVVDSSPSSMSLFRRLGRTLAESSITPQEVATLEAWVASGLIRSATHSDPDDIQDFGTSRTTIDCYVPGNTEDQVSALSETLSLVSTPQLHDVMIRFFCRDANGLRESISALTGLFAAWQASHGMAGKPKCSLVLYPDAVPAARAAVEVSAVGGELLLLANVPDERELKSLAHSLRSQNCPFNWFVSPDPRGAWDTAYTLQALGLIDTGRLVFDLRATDVETGELRPFLTTLESASTAALHLERVVSWLLSQGLLANSSPWAEMLRGIPNNNLASDEGIPVLYPGLLVTTTGITHSGTTRPAGSPHISPHSWGSMPQGVDAIPLVPNCTSCAECSLFGLCGGEFPSAITRRSGPTEINSSGPLYLYACAVRFHALSLLLDGIQSVVEDRIRKGPPSTTLTRLDYSDFQLRLRKEVVAATASNPNVT